MEDLKRRLDALHSRAHADLDASFSRVSKRIKVIPAAVSLSRNPVSLPIASLEFSFELRGLLQIAGW